MENIYLVADIGKNAVVNADGTTLLRTIYLVQGTSYEIYLAFQQNGLPIATPAIVDFTFTAKKAGSSTNLFSTSYAVDSGNADYPKKFTVLPASEALGTAISGLDEIALRAQIGWVSGVTTTLLTPFTAKVSAGSTGSLELDYTTTVNGVSGDVQIEGTNGVSVTTDENTITVDGGRNFINYTTPGTAETKVLTPTSPNFWLVNATLSNATFTLPNAAYVGSREYTFKKIDASAHTLTVNTSNGQTIKSFSRLAVNGGTVSISSGVFYDASLHIKAQGDSITVVAAAGGWITDDFTGDVI